MTSVSLTARIAITLCFMGLLVAVSVVPGRALPGDSAFVWAIAKTPTLLQKTMHVCLYGLLTLLWVWTLDTVPKSYRLVIAAAIAVCFGATMEWYQTRVPGRFGTLFDVALNAGGAVLGLLAALFLF
jgi:hypothetical protein